jgi:acyl-CoA reductase-like NAD-dependent aldehyde dehydrogenase
VVAKFAHFVSQVPVGPGLDPKSLIGPVSNKMQLDKVVGYVEDARARGARIVCGGVRPPGPGFFYPLTVIADATDEMRVVSEEQFGPVIPIIKYRTVDEAIRRANAVEVGLGGSVWGNDPKEAAGYAQQLQCGTAWVNQHAALHPLAPFGGIKASGLGVENNLEGLHEYTTIQVLSVAL